MILTFKLCTMNSHMHEFKVQLLANNVLCCNTISAHFDLRTICNELGVVKFKWFEIGVQLGIPRAKLMEFQREDDPVAAGVDYWLNGNVENISLSWRSIVKALRNRHVRELTLAQKIEEKYGQQENKGH